MLMRANPELLEGRNKLWIRFFLLAVFATMYVRDHQRHEFFEAMGFDVDDYDRRVIKLTSLISQQVFPVSLDVENPKFWALLDRVSKNAERIELAKRRGGLVGRVQRALLVTDVAMTLGRAYVMRVRKNVLPADMRLAPVW